MRICMKLILAWHIVLTTQLVMADPQCQQCVAVSVPEPPVMGLVVVGLIVVGLIRYRGKR